MGSEMCIRDRGLPMTDGYPPYNPIIDQVPFWWWRGVHLSSEPVDSISGFLPTFNYHPEEGYRTSAVRVDDLRPGDADPRHPDFVVDRIHMILDIESQPICGYLFLRRSDGQPMVKHPADFLFAWPWVAEDEEVVFNISRDSVSNWLPSEAISEEVLILAAEDELLPDGWISPWLIRTTEDHA